MSNSFCVDRYREEFLGLIRSGSVQIVFANESELHSLYQTGDFGTAGSHLRAKISLVSSPAPSGDPWSSRATRFSPCRRAINRVVDTTGAGDYFAAGFLRRAHRRRTALETCARLGALAAAEIIQHIGARPLADLAQLAAQNGISV